METATTHLRVGRSRQQEESTSCNNETSSNLHSYSLPCLLVLRSITGLKEAQMLPRRKGISAKLQINKSPRHGSILVNQKNYFWNRMNLCVDARSARAPSSSQAGNND